MSHVTTALVAAKALIQDPKNWTKNVLARRAGGAVTSPLSADAVCFCSMGALEKALTDLPSTLLDVDVFLTRCDAEDLMECAVAEITGSGAHVPSYNDYSTHAEVIKMFDLAIQKSEEEEQRND